MCGNAIRCVGKYLFEHHLVDREEITVETLSGVKRLKLYSRCGKVSSATVDMAGPAELVPARIPVAPARRARHRRAIEVEGSHTA